MKKTIIIRFIIFGIIILFSSLLLKMFISRDNRTASSVSKKIPYNIIIEIEDKTLYLMENNKCIKKYPIASGAPDMPSPIGQWKITQKSDWGEGFGGRWMGLNVPWGRYGIHGTIFSESIGYDASHGCIRMYNNDVKELYSLVYIGTPVTIINGSFGPFGTGFQSINPGDRGSDVLAIQIRLKDLGYFKGTPNGIYDDSLKHATHKFQRQHGLVVKNTISKQDYLKMGFKDFQ